MGVISGKNPHFIPTGETFFITIRLTDSLPLKLILKLKEEKENELKRISLCSDAKIRTEKYRLCQSVYFGKFDKLLDSCKYGALFLKDEKVCEMIKRLIHYYDGKEYDLLCYTIMPNHIHLVLSPLADKLLTGILQKLKSRSAIKANKMLGRNGPFWQHESYDHVVRNEAELHRIINYVVNNPVKAGLCNQWEDWKGNYINIL